MPVVSIVRRVVASRAKDRCEYCRAPVSATAYTFHLDHIIPLARGGRHEPMNLALACAPCNLAKQDRMEARDPVTRKIARLFNPRQDNWSQHFRWGRNCKKVYGRTSVGRATVAALDMNNRLQQQARLIWRKAGLIP
jgi:hypothetical protein